MKGNGKMINKMEKEKKFGQMVPYITESILMERKMDLVNLNGKMVASIQETL